MKQALQNQVLAIVALQRQWQLVGQEAQNFAQRMRWQMEDSVRCELAAEEHLKSYLQKEVDAQMNNQMDALQGVSGSC